jgi:uncharacterized protein YeaO (DUF488 family)
MSSRARTARVPGKRKPAPAKARKPTRRARTLIRVKRAYDAPEESDGMRILIDRLWPRGVTKDKLAVEAWPNELTPSTGLRKWYKHDPAQFAEFRARYLAELQAHAAELAELRKAVRGKTVTLVTATRVLDFSHAPVLIEALSR